MFVHNKKKRFVLLLVNIFLEIIWLPKRLFVRKPGLNTLVPRKILLVRLDHIGDVVMTSPAFSLLREKFIDTKLLLLTSGAGKQLFSEDPRIDEVLVFDWLWGQDKKRQLFSWAKFKKLVKLIAYIRKQKIDVLVDFRGDIRFTLLFGVLGGIGIRVSNSRCGNSSLLDHISTFNVDRHEVERSVDVVECFVRADVPLRPKLYLNSGELRQIQSLVQHEGLAEFPPKYALIAPYSSRDVKSWPRDHFKKVIRHLVANGFTCFIVGAKEDGDDAQLIASEFDEGVFSLAGKTSIRQLAALSAVSTVVVGVDTGVLHIASCFDVPIFALFGPTRPIEFRPYSPHAKVLQTNSCQCDQFLHVKCDCPLNGYARCLSDLTPERVISALSLSADN